TADFHFGIAAGRRRFGGAHPAAVPLWHSPDRPPGHICFHGAGAWGFPPVSWVDTLGISYHVGADGLNIGLIFMGAVVAFAAACASWEIQERQKEFYV